MKLVFQIASLDIVLNRLLFMKLFNANNTETVKARQVFLSFELLSD